jgi:hypothetical protein
MLTSATVGLVPTFAPIVPHGTNRPRDAIVANFQLSSRAPHIQQQLKYPDQRPLAGQFERL